jgi:hypothetical protein
VAAGRISVIAENYVLIPGPRLTRLYEDMAAALRRAAMEMSGEMAAPAAPPAPLRRGGG